jgi:threonine dehydrogenase-like Zn-dependent dehydrogenase
VTRESREAERGKGSDEGGQKNSVAVIGCGPVGLMAVLSAIHLGGSPVFALDTQPERLQLAKEFGAEPVQIFLGGREEGREGEKKEGEGGGEGRVDALEKIKSMTGGRGVDCVCEAVGSQAAIRDGFNLLRPGGVLSSVGVHTEKNFTGFTPIEGYDKNITYKSGRCSARVFMNEVLEMVEEGGWADKITKIITHRVDLKDEGGVKKAYEIFNGRQENCIKVVFTVQ